MENVAGAFQVTHAFVCESNLVSDPLLFERLWREAVGG